MWPPLLVSSACCRITFDPSSIVSPLQCWEFIKNPFSSTCLTDRPYCCANSRSLLSWPGTPITAWVPGMGVVNGCGLYVQLTIVSDNIVCYVDWYWLIASERVGNCQSSEHTILGFGRFGTAPLTHTVTHAHGQCLYEWCERRGENS